MKIVSSTFIDYHHFHGGDSLLQLAVAPQRASSARRIERLHRLAAELAVREIGYIGITKLLNCSQSAARGYVQEFRDAGLITSRPNRQLPRCVDKITYRLLCDSQLACAVLAKLTDFQRCTKPSETQGREVEQSSTACRIHIMGGDAKIALRSRNGPAQRDPLVAALFGPPGMLKQRFP